MSTHQTNGEVLLIGGAFGVGKTSVAKELGLRLGRSWLYVDEVRLTFQRCHVTLPEKTEALYFFEETPALWSLPPERLRDGLIGVGGSSRYQAFPTMERTLQPHPDLDDDTRRLLYNREVSYGVQVHSCPSHGPAISYICPSHGCFLPTYLRTCKV